jgi:hypothetical protein
MVENMGEKAPCGSGLNQTAEQKKLTATDCHEWTTDAITAGGAGDLSRVYRGMNARLFGHARAIGKSHKCLIWREFIAGGSKAEMQNGPHTGRAVSGQSVQP